MKFQRRTGGWLTAALAAWCCAPAGAATCSSLTASWAANATVLAGTAELASAAGQNPAYCLVNLRISEAINVRVGLPLSPEDGGTGNVQGAWNGRVQNLGGGGYAGSVGNVAGTVGTGYVASSTDTGHGAAWCNATDPATGLPNSQKDCGLIGGAFVINGQNKLVKRRVDDFIRRSLLEQTQWALRLAQAYYGVPAQRNYWNGCSTGGRQGFEMAQSFGDLFDGLLVGAPAMNWNRFIMGNLWAPTTTYATLGAAGLPAAKSAAANAAAVAACDADDGVVDGLIAEPRRCRFDASALVCTGTPGEPSTCLTAAEAATVNSIWNGPATANGERIWGGVTKGTSFDTNLPGGNQPNGINLTYFQNWLMTDPTYDWHNLTAANYQDQFVASYKKFRDMAATDNTNLDKVRTKGAKILHYHGLGDALIYPFTSQNYVSRVFDRYGVPATQAFMRSFFFPGVGHCSGGDAPQPSGLFDTLVDWVEKGVAPDHVVARQNATSTRPARTQKVCKYPDQRIYNGPDPNLETSYSCQVLPQEPADLRQAGRTFLEP